MKVLVAVDASENARRVVDYVARSVGKDQDVEELILLTAIYPFTENLYGRTVVLDRAFIKEINEKFYKEREEELQSQADKLTAAGLKVKTAILFGDPAETILKYSNDHKVDWIIMGSSGMGLLKSAVLGSVSYKVLQKASMPVTIIK